MILCPQAHQAHTKAPHKKRSWTYLLTYLHYCSLKHEWFDYLMTAYFVNLCRHHMCLICGAPAIWMPCPGLCERPVQFSNLEGGLTCELRHAYCTVQKRIGLDSNARSGKHCPKALHPMFSPLFLFFLFFLWISNTAQGYKCCFLNILASENQLNQVE